MPYNASLRNQDYPRELIKYPNIVAKVAAYTCKPEDSGTIFTTVGATAAVTFTLPPIASGPWEFTFVNAVDLAMTVSAETAGTLLGLNHAGYDSVVFNTTATRIGGAVKVVCDGTSAVAIVLTGAGGVITT